MRKATGAVRLVMKNVFYMGFTVQICLGLVWMVGNLPKKQDFPLVEGGVYSLLAKAVGEVSWPVCLLQLFLALYAGYRLLKAMRVKGRAMRVFGSLALMTLPMAMQCHMALLPYSLVCSAELLKLSFVCGMTGKKADCCWRELVGLLACYAVQVLLWPGYWMPGAILPLLMLLWREPGMLRNRKVRLKGCVLALCLAIAAAGGYGLHRVESSNGEGSWRWALVKRVCWPTLWVDFDRMPEEIQEAVRDVIWISAHYPNHMDLYFKPAVDEAMAREDTEAALKQMAVQSWRVHYPMIVRQIGWDVLGYSVTPLVLPQQLAGQAYDSCSGRNYEIMRNRMPVLTKYYVYLACWWYGMSLGIALIAVVMSMIAEPRKRKEAAVYRFPVSAVLFSAAVTVLFFTMQGAGVMDYKYTVWVNQLWILFGIAAVSKKEDAA